MVVVKVGGIGCHEEIPITPVSFPRKLLPPMLTYPEQNKKTTKFSIGKKDPTSDLVLRNKEKACEMS
jgi:hypothetical protein